MSSNKEKLGAIGESIVAYYTNATLSENKYDMEKDMILENGKKIEVKTQNRHPWRHEFTVNTAYSNQLKKCLEVDHLMFVEYDSSDEVKIWECVDRSYNVFTTKSGRRMAGWPIKDMILYKTIVKPELAAAMRALSQSKTIN